MKRINWSEIYSELEKNVQLGNAEEFNRLMDMLETNLNLLNEHEKVEIFPQVILQLRSLLKKAEKQFQMVDDILEDGSKKESANNQYGKY